MGGLKPLDESNLPGDPQGQGRGLGIRDSGTPRRTRPGTLAAVSRPPGTTLAVSIEPRPTTPCGVGGEPGNRYPGTRPATAASRTPHRGPGTPDPLTRSHSPASAAHPSHPRPRPGAQTPPCDVTAATCASAGSPGRELRQGSGRRGPATPTHPPRRAGAGGSLETAAAARGSPPPAPWLMGGVAGGGAGPAGTRPSDVSVPGRPRAAAVTSSPGAAAGPEVPPPAQEVAASPRATRVPGAGSPAPRHRKSRPAVPGPRIPPQPPPPTGSDRTRGRRAEGGRLP